VHLRGLVASLDGRRILRAEGRAHRDRVDALGTELAERLVARGADEILAAVYAAAEESA